MSPRTRSLPLALAVAAALLAVVRPAHAQNTDAYIRQATAYGDGSGFSGCSNSGLVSASISCTSGWSTATGSARIDATNGLHASTHMVAGTTPGYARAVADAAFSDVITLAVPSSVSSFRIDVSLHGVLSGPGANGLLRLYAGAGDPKVLLALDSKVVGDQWLSESYEVPVIDGRIEFGLELESLSQVYVPTGICPEVGGCPSDAASDLDHTGRIVGLTALDENGVEVSGVVARSASGVQYALAGGTILGTTTAPEPASLALLGAGALPLGFAAARRRRVAQSR